MFRWRTLILELHICAGLLCIPYLLIIGISSLNFNHSFLSEKTGAEASTWSEAVSLRPDMERQEMVDQLMSTLSIYGWFIPWASNLDSANSTVVIVNPGKKYVIDIDYNQLSARVSETRGSVSGLFKVLHGLGEPIPHAPWWINSWRYYQSVGLYSMVIWSLGGLFLWITRTGKPLSEQLIMASLFVGCIILIVVLWHTR